MKKILLLLFSFFSIVSYSQYTLIPDPEFEWYLIYNGYDIGAIDGKVLTSKIEVIKEIYFFPGAANINITDLTGIENFKALEKLNCTNCNLTTLDLSKNIFLTDLICDNNKLTSLNVIGCANLKSINCSGNQFTSLDFSQTINLKSLYCRNSKLSVLNLNTNITYLDCSYSNLSTLDLSKCTLLESLVCPDNQFKNMDISKNINLTDLSCYNNQLINLDVSKNIKLRSFSCQNNQLKNLDITSNLNLLFFICSSNQLTNLDISQNTKLTNLNCSSNQLSNLDISNNTNLSELLCTNNQIISLDIFKNINLVALYCFDNKLTSLNTNSNLQLKILYCHNNLITSLDVSLNNNLEIFRCANNQLTYLDLRNNQSMNWWNDTSYWTNNPKLNCIYVLDASFFNYFFSNRKDATANYVDGNPPQFESTIQTICSKQNPTIKDIVVSGNNIKWFDSINGVNELPETTLLVEGVTYFAMNTSVGCESLKSAITISLKDTPRPSALSPQNLCKASNLTLVNLNVTGSLIKWYTAINGGSLLPETTPLNNGTTYYASQTNNGCESPRVPVLVNFLRVASPVTQSSQSFCNQQKAILSDIVISGQNVKWYDSSNNGNQLPNSTLLQNGSTYFATQTISGCESDRTPVIITIKPNPTPSLPSPQNFCIQQNATLNNITIAGQNIKWYDILTNGNLLLNTTSLQNGTTYYASQTINGCESERIPVVVNIQNTPAPTGNASQSFCSSQNATLNDIAINGTSIKLYMAATNGTPLASSTLLQDGITYYATQTINDCESLSRLGVTISLINTLNATNYSETICDDQNNGNEIVNLKSYNSNLIGSTGNTFGYYTSANAAGNQITTSQITNFSNYNLTLGKHSVYVRIDSPNSCHQIVELQITLVSKPIINIPNIVPICENNTITIDAGSGSDTYLWSNGASTSSITVSNPGDFSVIVSKNYGTTSCSSTKNFTVKKSNIATITSIETKDWTDNENSITAYVTGAGDYEYSIDGIYFQNSNQFLNVHKGEYTVEVRDKNGCGTATDEVYLLMFPKFFTPNGDGYNDTWSIHFSDLEIGLTVKIFDRYGKFIKELIQNATWNGTFNGQELPATDYWFVVTRANGKEYRGHFSLKR
ncbi:gliding motility-associated-like protein [Flavobacterium sp. CG_23.5]|uniref:Ig-like domain-containing protein n=1 Tax=unclassified Flavobacterium TaxID=196869 RepID=UPI0018CA0B32|nr:MULTISPECIES: T9SS type B sorting domain-containing protein [unclassified Flavobacterium]MBG6111529.1 gliding motility-associated-like protein [Flavobacterium sp. CG_9.10]MBP2282620.1 gliding motility-associated-like protein [Flavobacterium sp. CG_23.5]